MLGSGSRLVVVAPSQAGWKDKMIVVDSKTEKSYFPQNKAVSNSCAQSTQ